MVVEKTMEQMLRESHLKVCGKFLRQERNRKVMSVSRIIILEHILPTTEMLVYHLAKAGADVFSIVAKPYSIDPIVLARLQANGFSVLQKSYDDLENTKILDNLLRSAIEQSRKDKRKILIVDVGGYFAIPLSRLKSDDIEHIAGVVEDTTFGHNRYLLEAKNIGVPIISVARSRLKEIEAHFVGRDAVQAVAGITREIGEPITGKNAVVIGYGMIGKNVARSLSAYDLRVSVYDIRDHRNLKAFMMGFRVHKKAELIRTADIVFSATGWSSHPIAEQRVPGLSIDEILDRLNDNAMLVSVGSKDNEFDIKQLKELAQDKRNIGDHIVRYTLPNKKVVYVIRDGTAVNFHLPSIPTGVLDLVFAEIVLALIFFHKRRRAYPMGVVNVVEDRYWSQIAKDWLRFFNYQP